ncbi:MAG: GNAT family N-acetyltransferase [Anaerovoracaceae bacterium]|jgi:predicted GNAT family acetyltransferase
MLEIKKGSKSFYVGDSDENPLAEMVFSITDEKTITIESTMVSEELGGQGVGKLLLKELTDWVRQENKKIIPTCPYAKAQMEKNEEYHDLML